MIRVFTLFRKYVQSTQSGLESQFYKNFRLYLPVRAESFFETSSSGYPFFLCRALFKRDLLKILLLLICVHSDIFAQNSFFSRSLKNPFLVDFEISEDPTNEELEQYQNELRQHNIADALDSRWRKEQKLARYFQKPVSRDDFFNRLQRGLWQTMVSKKKGLYPEKNVVTLNGGGEDCIVLFSSYDRVYPKYVKSLIKALEEVGFKGNVYYRLGGYPNPTKKEILYAGVPYAFKMFMLEEARNLGFRYLLWLDASVFPLKNPQPLFDLIRQKGVVYKDAAPLPQFIFEETRRDIFLLTGIDVMKCRHLRMPVFGIDTKVIWFQKFLDYHRNLVEIGTPFFSALPEEFVLTALKELYFPKTITPTEMLLGFDYVPSVANGYYFYLRFH